MINAFLQKETLLNCINRNMKVFTSTILFVFVISAMQVSADNDKKYDELTKYVAALKSTNSNQDEINFKNGIEPPRRLYTNPNTHHPESKIYMSEWKLIVERVGNLNYPDEVKKKKLSGEVIVDVALNSDGTIHKIEILKASEHKLLNDSVVTMIEWAGQWFRPFPKDLKNQVDVLHITKLWRFDSQRFY